jgi:hypothetical protein
MKPLGFFLKRAGQALLVMLVIAVIAFAVRAALGDPLREIVGESVPEAERAALRHELGLDAPWPVQLGRYIGNAARGDLGNSYIYKRSTLQIVLAKFPASFELVLAASLIVLIISLPAGIYCAVRQNSFGARLILGFSVLGISVPVFLTGIFLITIFSVWLGWLPAFGRGETVKLGLWETSLLKRDGLAHLILNPAAALHQAGAFRHVGRVGPRLCPHRAGQGRVTSPGLDSPCAPQCADPAGRGRRAADRQSHRLYTSDRDRVSMAGHGLSVSRSRLPRRHPADHDLSHRCRLPLCRHQ